MNSKVGTNAQYCSTQMLAGRRSPIGVHLPSTAAARDDMQHVAACRCRCRCKCKCGQQHSLAQCNTRASRGPVGTPNSIILSRLGSPACKACNRRRLLLRFLPHQFPSRHISPVVALAYSFSASFLSLIFLVCGTPFPRLSACS